MGLSGSNSVFGGQPTSLRARNFVWDRRANACCVISGASPGGVGACGDFNVSGDCSVEITQQASNPNSKIMPARNPKRVAARDAIAAKTQLAREAQKRLWLKQM